MSYVFPTEIREFDSLKDLNSFIDRELRWYEFILKEYNETLGKILRKSGSEENTEELLKKLREKGFSHEKRKKGKSKGGSPSDEWVTYKGFMFSVKEECIAEVYFNAVESISGNVERLKEFKALIEDLSRMNLGSDIVYLVYFVSGVPQRIIIRHVKESRRKITISANIKLPLTEMPMQPPSETEELKENKIAATA